MAKAPERRKRDHGPPASLNYGTYRNWLASKPREWSIVIAARAALRVIPIAHNIPEFQRAILAIFRANAISLFNARYPAREDILIAQESYKAYETARGSSAPDFIMSVASAADAATVATAYEDSSGGGARAVSDGSNAARHAEAVQIAFRQIRQDAQNLHSGALTPEQLACTPLWHTLPPPRIGGAWQGLVLELLKLHPSWSVWIDWYDDVVAGVVAGEARDAAFTDVPGKLSWTHGPITVNTEILRRLATSRSDPFPIEGIPSPIAISRRPDGRIGADAGVLAAPTLPQSLTPKDHARALSTCRSRAVQLGRTVSLPNFQGRREYGEAIAAYLEWLPTEAGAGNILLADGEARVLNKLFAADEAIIAAGFASRLSVFLEDHIALRAFYPEVERHYHSVRTGRIATPLARDAVEGIQVAIHANTPTVFDESVAPAMDETAKPLPEARPLSVEDAPPLEPGQPKPPKDPIADVDPAKSRNFTFASAANRIWEILQKGKDLPQVIDGWQKTYEQFKPHIGTIVEWLKHFRPGAGDGTPPMPPTMSV